ncbi:uncharacterized protein LOC124519156 [Lynx rufus]|uniref:uncharacterized protein LOC124519156 n=1 Tax=Lynx rufus TaxID=61384 RepID=UPI001F128039|nr:uncharacterized protein LOC124519156 [Lynx rufus]
MGGNGCLTGCQAPRSTNRQASKPVDSSWSRGSRVLQPRRPPFMGHGQRRHSLQRAPSPRDGLECTAASFPEPSSRVWQCHTRSPQTVDSRSALYRIKPVPCFGVCSFACRQGGPSCVPRTRLATSMLLDHLLTQFGEGGLLGAHLCGPAAGGSTPLHTHGCPGLLPPRPPAAAGLGSAHAGPTPPSFARCGHESFCLESRVPGLSPAPTPQLCCAALPFPARGCLWEGGAGKIAPSFWAGSPHEAAVTSSL